MSPGSLALALALLVPTFLGIVARFGPPRTFCGAAVVATHDAAGPVGVASVLVPPG